MAKNNVIKEPVKLRQKVIGGGNVSLYLDIYWQGRRKYEFLKLYLVPEKNKADRDRNRETLQLANTIKAQRIVEVQRGEYGFGVKSAAETTLFFEYYEKCVEARCGKESKGCWGNWKGARDHLRCYEPRRDITMAEITPEWVEGFRDYLQHDAVSHVYKHLINGEPKKLSHNSQGNYFGRLCACLNQAVEEDIISSSPAKRVEGISKEESTRQYLTIEEVQQMAGTPCPYDTIKRAFLFSCLTGLRRSDVEKLTWGEVQRQGNFARLIFRQKKTGGQEYLDISEQAAALMGEQGEAEQRVFLGLPSPLTINSVLRQWAGKAGISKYITFHCARHTFAVMQLDLGTDIYTVSKLLGHRNINTTQIYAKVMDKAKQAAMQRIPTIIKPTKQGDN